MTKYRWLIAIFSCLLIFAALAGFKYSQIQAAIAFGKSFPEPSATVEAEQASRQLVASSVSTIGEITAPQTVALRNELEGRITAVNFLSGAEVKKGDILLQLDISEESAQLNATQARANLALLNLQRAKKLWQEKTVSEESVDQAKAEYEISRANVAAIEAIINKKTLTAPFDAQTGLHHLEIGGYLQKDTLITTLVGLNHFYWVDFQLPLTKANASIGDSVEVSLPYLSDKQLRGSIIAIDSVASASSRNLRYRAKLESSQFIAPNTIVKVSVLTGSQEQVEIAATAILTDEMGNYVYLLDPDSKPGQYRARRQSVVLGKKNQQAVTVVSGLNSGDLVATQGSFKLRNNLLAFISERPTKPTSTELAE